MLPTGGFEEAAEVKSPVLVFEGVSGVLDYEDSVVGLEIESDDDSLGSLAGETEPLDEVATSLDVGLRLDDLVDSSFEADSD